MSSPADHSGQVLIRVHTHARTRTTPTDIKGLIIEATDDCDALEFPGLRRLAGVFRTRLELIASEPTGDPRRAKMLLMETNPLQRPRPVPDPTAPPPSRTEPSAWDAWPPAGPPRSSSSTKPSGRRT